MILNIFSKSVSLFHFPESPNILVARTPIQGVCAKSFNPMLSKMLDFSQRKMVISLRSLENDIHVLRRFYGPLLFAYPATLFVAISLHHIRVLPRIINPLLI